MFWDEGEADGLDKFVFIHVDLGQTVLDGVFELLHCQGVQFDLHIDQGLDLLVQLLTQQNLLSLQLLLIPQ